MSSEFISFKKIPHASAVSITITQKMHGTNAQIYIYQDYISGEINVQAGSRSRWISIYDDNYGFAKFVNDNKNALIDKLGFGRHYGEWCGRGINSGEGLVEKTLFLFNWRRFKDIELPQRVRIIPVIYASASFDIDLQIMAAMNLLKEHGSLASPGFMNVEGIVIDINGNLIKQVFSQEDVKWKGVKSISKAEYLYPDIDHLLQPIRLQKLLSRDEAYIREYPVSLPLIVKDYIADLIAENCITGTDEDIKAIKKALGKKVFHFVKAEIQNSTIGEIR